MNLNELFNNLSQTMENMLDSLEPVPYQPTEVSEYKTITFDGTEKCNTRWKALLSQHIHTAKTVEIHCWNEETEEIALALQYGTIKPSNWKYGTIIEGPVTPEFTHIILNMPKPSNPTNGYNMMTPFFGIIFDNGFSSEHYGTENHIKLN